MAGKSKKGAKQANQNTNTNKPQAQQNVAGKQ